MAQHEATRTLVKSPPELWTECSDAGSLGRHLNRSFGEIRITRLEPETAVAWEGERVSGTVRIEPSGWGTRVTLTAVEVETAVEEPDPEVEAQAEPEPEPDPEPEPVAELPAASPAPPTPPGRGRLLARMRSLFRPGRVVAEMPDPEPAPQAGPPAPPEPEPAPEPELREPEPERPPDVPEPERPEAESAPDAAKILASALDSLGQAHHRPFSRA